MSLVLDVKFIVWELNSEYDPFKHVRLH